MHLSSFFDRLLEKTEKIATGKLWGSVLGIIFMFVILINGISVVPHQHYQKLSQNPFKTRTDIYSENYWQETVLLPIIAFYSKLNSPRPFSILCLAIIISAYFLFALLVFFRLGSLPTLIFSTLLITSPLTTILLTWLGTPDGLTFFLTVPFLFTGSAGLIFILAILGTTNHITFFIAALEILVLRLVSRDDIGRFHLVIFILGGIIGVASVKIFLIANRIQAMSRFDYIFSKSLVEWVRMNFVEFPATLFSLFNIQWIIIPICLIMFFNTDRKYFTIVFVLLSVNYGVIFFAADTTRIFSLISWGILAHCIFHSFKLAKNEDFSFHNQFLQALITIALISFIAPRFYSWNGSIYTSPFYSFLMKIIK